jgi:hypothetical protein
MATRFFLPQETDIDLIKSASGIFREQSLKFDAVAKGYESRNVAWAKDFRADVTKSNR